jgi:hypothetical protein
MKAWLGTWLNILLKPVLQRQPTLPMVFQHR